jgi:alkylhydroperoxidase family enzyme
VTEEQLRELAHHRESGAFDNLEKAVIDYALAMTDTPAIVPDAVFDALRAHLDPAGLVELTAAIAWENFLARLSRGLALDPAGLSEGAFCPLPDAAGSRSQSGR